MKKLKICHVSLGTYPDKKDGSAKLQRGIYDELKKRGHDITLLTAKWDEGFNDPNIIAFNVPKLRFLWIFKFISKVRSYLKKNNFDIIQGNGSRGSLPIILSGEPYITYIHDVGPFQADFSRIPILKWLEKKNAEEAKIILCNSNTTKFEINKYLDIDLNKIHKVSCAVDSNFKIMSKFRYVIRQYLNVTGKPILLYIGRIAFYKGIEDIIKAYEIMKEKYFPDLVLIIGGKPTLKMKKTVKKWKKKYPTVVFRGMIPDHMLPILYNTADVFITYSYASEGFGITPVEAIACGTPVICSTLPAYKETLQNFATFVKPKNPELLSNIIFRHLIKPENYKIDILKSKKFLEQYTWKKVVDNIEKVYEKYLNLV